MLNKVHNQCCTNATNDAGVSHDHHLLILSPFFGVEGEFEHVSSRTVCLSSSDLLSQRLQGNMYFLFFFISVTSIHAQCHAAPNPTHVEFQMYWLHERNQAPLSNPGVLTLAVMPYSAFD